EANAGHAVFACAVEIDDFARGKLGVFSHAIQVESKFRIITDGNFDQTRSARCSPASTAPGSSTNRSSNSRPELLEHSFRRTTCLENDGRIEENGNAGVSRCKFDDTRDGRALEQLKYSQHFVQCFVRRILKLLAHAHD